MYAVAMQISRSELCVVVCLTLVRPLELPWFGRDGTDKIVGLVSRMLFVFVVFSDFAIAILRNEDDGAAIPVLVL